MKYKIPQTLVKVGRFDNPLEEAVRKYPEPLTNVPIELGDVVKYMLFKKIEEPFLLMVSQRKDRLVTAEYNVMLTVTSYSDSKNQQVAGRFETSRFTFAQSPYFSS